jgi:RNA polymerase sigma-70 factor (ECF subfamily)
MRRFQRGDARAFPELVRRHRGPVFAFVLRWTSDRARAEDILQETWLKVVRGAEAWSPRARFSTWLYTIARNACVDGARRERSRASEPLEAEPAADERSSPERAAASSELRPVLAAAIAALPESQREVFLLREMGGVPFHEIARITGAPEPTVKSRMRYALEALRARLAEVGVESPAGGRVA